MSSINKRQLLIIKHLINAKDTLSSDILASALGVTPKTVRNDIELINLLLERVGARIISRLGSGYKIEIFIQNEFYIFLQSFNEKYIDNSTIPNNNHDRIKYIIYNLLALDSHLKSDQLLDELYVSRSTLTNDLNQIRVILKSYQLELTHRPSYGVSIEGLEQHKRIALSDFFNIDEDSTYEPITKFKLYVDQKKIEDSIVKQLLEYNLSISLKSLKELTSLIQISITRFNQSKLLTITPEQIDQHKLVVECSIIEKSLEFIGFQLNETEIYFLAIYLASRMIYRADDQFNLMENKNLYFLSDEMLRFLFVHTNLDFSYDQEVRQLISRELKSMLLRIDFAIPHRNLPIIEIKQDNPAYEYALIMIDYLSKKYNVIVPEQEAIPFALILQKSLQNDFRNVLKLKICLVFSKGKNFCYTIESKLRKHFTNYIHNIDVLEYYQLCPSYEIQYDLIITDLPISRFNINIPIFQIQNQLNDFEQRKLTQFFTRKNLKLGWFLEALNRDLFIKNVDFTSKNDLIDFVSNRFCELGNVSNSIKELFLYRDNLSASEHGNNCALIHTMYQCSEQTQIALVVLKKPIIWKSESVQLIFFIANGQEERLYNFIDWLRQMLTQMNLIHELLKCEQYEDVCELFIEIFHRLELR